jgi:hypothetical protein
VKLHPQDPGQWTAQAHAVSCPVPIVEESPGPGFNRLRACTGEVGAERHAQESKREALASLPHRVLPDCSRTGRPVRRSTRYVSTGRQCFQSSARMVDSLMTTGAIPVYSKGTGIRPLSRRISSPRSRQEEPSEAWAWRVRVNQISAPVSLVTTSESRLDALAGSFRTDGGCSSFLQPARLASSRITAEQIRHRSIRQISIR